MYKIYISAVIIFNTYNIADETSVDEMIDFIVQEQFLSTQDIENSKESSTKIKDVWTFEKEINNQNPNWLLTEVSVE